MAGEHSVSKDLRVIRALIISAVAIVVGLGLIWYLSSSATDRRLERAIDDIVATRSEARLSECLRDNAQSATAVAQARTTAEVLIATAYRGRTPSAAETDVADFYVKAQEEAAKKLYPQRKCDPKSIDAFYKARTATTTTVPR